MDSERQTTFSWMVAMDLFLSGAGAAAFLLGFLLDFIGGFGALSRIVTLAGPVMVALGILLLVFDLGAKRRFYRMLANLNSWIARGFLILTCFILFSLAYALPSFGAFSWLPWSQTTVLGQVFGGLAAFFSILTILYTGFLFGEFKRIPFWNTPALPMLFLSASLYTGMAVLLLAGSFLPLAAGNPATLASRYLVIGETALVIVQLVILGVYVEISRHGTATALESVRLLIGPIFTLGVITAGLVIPLGLLLYSWVAGGAVALVGPLRIASILLLLGGVLLRYVVLRAGVRLTPFQL